MLTRFSIRRPGFPPPSDEWLRQRWGMFVEFTVPSMKEQSVMAFRWLVFCDSESPGWLIEALAATQVAECVVVVGEWTHEAAAEAVESRRTSSTVITSRLDNDDAISRDFIASVQAAATDDGFINFAHGLQLAAGRLYWRLDPSNAFITRVESTERIATVFVDDHDKLAAHGPVLQVRGRPMWLQVIHGDNLANEVKGIRVGRSSLEHFPIAPELEPAGWLTLAASRVATGTRMVCRVLRKPQRLMLLVRTRLPYRGR